MEEKNLEEKIDNMSEQQLRIALLTLVRHAPEYISSTLIKNAIETALTYPKR